MIFITPIISNSFSIIYSFAPLAEYSFLRIFPFFYFLKPFIPAFLILSSSLNAFGPCISSKVLNPFYF